MEAEHFDRLVRTLAGPGTRRHLVGLLTALPLGLTLAALLGETPDATAQGDDDHGSSNRRQRRRARNRHRPGQDQKRHKDPRRRKGKRKDRQPDPAPTPGCSPNPDAQTCAGQCGAVKNNCGATVSCPACPEITSFTATPTTIDSAATPPESATLAWSTSNATSCTIDDGAGPVSVDCNGNTSVGPAASTTYTLRASGAGGGPVQAQLQIEVEYCYPFDFSGSSGGPCPSGASEFCLTEQIVATSSAHAEEACKTCSTNVCIPVFTCGGAARAGNGGLFFYDSEDSPDPGCEDPRLAGEIADGFRNFVGRWAPAP